MVSKPSLNWPEEVLFVMAVEYGALVSYPTPIVTRAGHSHKNELLAPHHWRNFKSISRVAVLVK